MASCVLGFLLAFPIGSRAVAADLRKGARPNIVFVLADDLGIGDVKCFGGERCQIETPGFDRIAREGLRFTDAHVVTSFCVPTRMAILTGRYPWRFQAPREDGAWGFLLPRVSPSRLTLGRVMQSAGYHVGYVGKWHLGTRMQTTDGKTQGSENVDFSKPLERGPNDYGIDYSFILPASLDMYPYAFLRDHRFVGQVTARKGWSAFHRVGPAAEDFEDSKVLNRLAGEAEGFIARRSKNAHDGNPFFLYLALTSPHTPVAPSSPFQGKSRLGVYGDFVMETDHVIARILDVLDQHELAENTLLIATSDHGAAPYVGRRRKATPGQIRELEQDGHFSSGIYRGYKFSIYEGGLRVPMVVRWPAVVRPGSVCNQLVGVHDLFRTLAEITEQETPQDAAPDSISFRSLLSDPTATSRTNMIMQSTGSFAVRDGRFKLAVCPGSGCGGELGNRPRRDDAWKSALERLGRSPKNRDELKQAPFVQLFDLQEDPGETNNLAVLQPSKVSELLRVLEQQIDAGRSTPGPELTNDVSNVDYLQSVPNFVLKDLP
ncbi:MAG: arylsulfatase [Pirellulales bacterium]